MAKVISYGIPAIDDLIQDTGVDVETAITSFEVFGVTNEVIQWCTDVHCAVEYKWKVHQGRLPDDAWHLCTRIDDPFLFLGVLDMLGRPVAYDVLVQYILEQL